MSKTIFKLSKTMDILFLIICALFILNIVKFNIIPNIYICLFIIIMIILNIILFYLTWFNKKVKSKIVTIILIVIFASLFSYANANINKMNSFLKSFQEEDLQIEYKVVVLNNKFESTNDLVGQSIGYLEDNNEFIKEELNFEYKEVIIENFNDLGNKLLNGQVSAIVVESNVLQSLYDEIDGFEASTSVLGKIYITDTKEQINTNSDYKFSLEPFIVYISGVDQYGNVNTVRGRSDVNILAVVNPKEHKILLVNTPRDYYVRLHSSGAFDKLTHAGIYSIEESIATIEDLYGIEIDYYIRVDFNTIIDLVDAVGGISIYSDTDFVPWTDKECHISSGDINLDGKCALAYARERMSYTTGDRHRGENQQQIISAIIEKVTSSKTLLTRYNTLLTTLNGKFKSNAPTEMFTNYIKYQLSNMQKWNIESISVDGTDSMNYTYSFGTSMQLYVMNPDYNTVAIASNKIKEYLNMDNQ